MLVVLTLMLLLAALAIAFVPKATERARAARGADLLQQWLLTARQWAKRDRVPTGIRLQAGQILPNKGSPNAAYVTDLQYIQQPDDWHALSSTLSVAAGTNTVTITGTGVDLCGGQGLYSAGPPASYLNQSLWAVQIGDYLEIQGGGLLHRITAVQSSAPAPGPVTGDTLVLASSPGSIPGGTTQYRIIRSPRILAGEQTLQLPQDVAIDTTTNTTFGNTLPLNSGTNSYDIVFSPSGNVIGANTYSDRLILWVRDVTQDTPKIGAANTPLIQNTPGDQTLVVVFVRGGFIAAYQVDNSVNTVSTNQIAPGQNVMMGVQDPSNITAGMYLILDLGVPMKQEAVQVARVIGNTVTLTSVQNAHLAAITVTSDPYNITRSGRSSGL
jgi:hypothetical protein